jgi:hypothetical protein
MGQRVHIRGWFMLLLATSMSCDGRETGPSQDTNPSASSTKTEDPLDDADAISACLHASSMDACERVDVAPAYRCAWVRILTLVDEQSCETRDGFQCVAFGSGASTPGCSPIPGCEASGPEDPGTMVVPAHRDTAEGITLMDVCGTTAESAAVGWTTCTSGASNGGDVPACACVCESAP